MLYKEAVWIGKEIEKLELAPGQTVVDMGSGSDEYRHLFQPYIDFCIFRPIRLKGIRIIHVDAAPAPGVDAVQDVSRADFKWPEDQAADVVIASNVLEHVEDIGIAFRNICACVKPGGTLIVTGPRVFPHHACPIDNGYRPSLEELESLVVSGGFEIESSKAMRTGDVYPWPVQNQGFMNPVNKLLGFFRIRAVLFDIGRARMVCVRARKKVLQR